eukprot:RCo023652
MISAAAADDSGGGIWVECVLNIEFEPLTAPLLFSSMEAFDEYHSSLAEQYSALEVAIAKLKLRNLAARNLVALDFTECIEALSEGVVLQQCVFGSRSAQAARASLHLVL